MIRRRLMSMLFVLGLATTAWPGRSTELQGILTQVTGAVQLAGPGVKRDPLASPWQVIRGGVRLHIPEGGNAGIVCSNSRFVRLQGPAAWSLTEEACTAGQELTPAEYALVAPQGGRFKVVHGLMVLERGMRGRDDDDPLADSGTLALRLRRLEGLGLEGAALEAARGGLFAENELYANAADAYRGALTMAPSAEIRVTLADVYLSSGLYGLAEARYREALQNSPPTARAAATFGLGRVEYFRGRYKEAVVFFQKACELYAELKLTEEKEAARRARDRAALQVSR